MSTPDLTELPFGDTADFEAVERGLAGMRRDRGRGAGAVHRTLTEPG